MAATNYTPIQLYHSTTASAAPTAGNLVNGELAINILDGKLYYKDNGGTVQIIASKGTGTIGGSTTQVQYNLSGALAGSSNFTFNGTTATINTLNLTNALGAAYGGTAQSTYAQGDLLYASAANTLAKLPIGINTYILTSNGTIPGWSIPSSVVIGTATNLAGGAAGSVPYQSGAGATTFLSIGTANQVVTSTGSAPQWSSALTLTGLSNSGLTTLDKTVTVGNTSFNGAAVFAPATPAKVYLGTGTVTDVTSAIAATNAAGAIVALGVTPIAATNANVTYTNASTLYIAGAPSAGTNITITNPYALYVAAGDAYFGGTVTAGTVNLTTLDLTNLEVTNIKAKDGTASMTLADSTGVVTFSKATVIETTDNTNAALRITQLGTGNALLVEDSANPDSTPFVVTATGDVGIGTSSPAQPLDVVSNSSANAISIRGRTADDIGTLNFSTNAGSVIAQIQMRPGDNEFRLLVSGARSQTFYANGSERMRLDSSGNLGLGVTPSAWGAGYRVIQIGTSGAIWGNSSGGSQILLNANSYFDGTNYRYSNSTFASEYYQSAGAHVWRTAPSGTANSASVTSGASYTVVALGSSTLAQWQAFFNDSSNNPLTVTPTLGQVLTGNATGTLLGGGLVTQNISFTQAMTLLANGNLGIGETNPAVRLDVLGQGRVIYNTGATNTGDQSVVTVGATTSGAYASTYGAGLQFQVTNSGGGYAGSRIVSRLGADNNTANLVFQARNYGYTDSMTLDASGNLAIGHTSTPATRLDVRTSLSATANPQWVSDFYAITSGSTDSTYGGGIRLYTKNLNGNYWPAAIAAINDAGGSNLSSLGFYTAAAGPTLNERARITSVGGFETRPVATGHAVFNEDGVDADFRVEGDTDTHLIFADASTDRVGIGTNNPLNLFQLGTFGAIDGNSLQCYLRNNVYYDPIDARDESIKAGYSNVIVLDNNSGGILFQTTSTSAAGANVALSLVERARISSDGTFRVKGAGTAGTTDAVQFSGSAPASTLILDSSGNLGVGATSPSNGVEVAVGSKATAGILVTGNNSPRIVITETSGTVTGGIVADAAAIYLGTSTNHPTVLRTNGTERARITSGGDLLVGTQTSGGKLTVEQGNANANGAFITNQTYNYQTLGLHNTATANDNILVAFGTEASYTTRGSIQYNRGAGLIAYLTTSDYRAKDISGPVVDSGALIDSVPVYMGKMKGATQERPMFIAHETPAYAHTGVKDAVDADGKPVYQQMDASALVPVMWAEIQSLRARVAQLEQGA